MGSVSHIMIRDVHGIGDILTFHPEFHKGEPFSFVVDNAYMFLVHYSKRILHIYISFEA